MVGLIRGVSEGLGPVGGAAAIYSLSGLLLNLHGWISAYSADPERLFTRRESVIRQL